MHKRHSQQGVRSLSHGFKGLPGNPVGVIRQLDAEDHADETKEQE